MRTAVAGDHSASWRTPWEPRLHAPGEPLLAVDRAVPVNNFGTEVTLRPGSPTRPGGKARDTGRRGTGRNPRDQRPRGNHKRKGGGRSRHVFVLSLKVDVSARTGHTHRGRDNAQARPRGTPGAPLGTPSSAACRQHIVGDRGVARPVVRSPLPGLRRVLPQRHAGRLDRQPGRRACSTSRSRAALTSSHRPCGSRGMPGSRTECHPSRITPRWLSRAGTDSGRGKPLRHMGL